MFQILCTLVLDVPASAECLTFFFHVVSPDVLLAFEPWVHVDHAGVACGCRSSDRTGAYVHAVVFDRPTTPCALTGLFSQPAPSDSGDLLPGGTTTGVPVPASCVGVPSVRPGSVPFIYD